MTFRLPEISLCKGLMLGICQTREKGDAGEVLGGQMLSACEHGDAPFGAPFPPGPITSQMLWSHIPMPRPHTASKNTQAHTRTPAHAHTPTCSHTLPPCLPYSAFHASGRQQRGPRERQQWPHRSDGPGSSGVRHRHHRCHTQPHALVRHAPGHCHAPSRTCVPRCRQQQWQRQWRQGHAQRGLGCVQREWERR